MPGANGSHGVADTTGVEWHGEQVERARAVFDSVSGASADHVILERIAAELPRAEDRLVTGIGVFRDLLRVEVRTAKFERLLRTWVGKITTSIRERDFATAGIWMRALTESPTYPPEFQDYVDAAIGEVSRSDHLDELVVALAEEDSPAEAIPLLGAWGKPLVDHLIGGIVVDDPPVNRRHLVDYLAWAGRNDTRLITAHLADDRWFVVRNVAIAVAKAGRPAAAPALESMADHHDDRVRVEVLRGLAYLQGDDAVPRLVASLEDESHRVRQVAASLLRASPSPLVVPGIRSVLEAAAIPPEEAERLVELVAERRDAGVDGVLEELAGRRIAMGSARAIRDAARAALKRRSG